MQHTLRTRYGDADVWYGNRSEKPLEGGEQGNGASLPLFATISCILLSVLESAVQGVRIYTAMTLQLL